MADYQTEFPDFPAADMPAIPATFVDTSWHNDMCPSFTSDEIGLLLWVDYLDPSKRKFQDSQGNASYPRFSVQSQAHGIETSGPHLDTDDWTDVIAFIAARQVERQSLATQD